MEEKEELLSKYNQSLQAHAQALDTIFELRYLLAQAQAKLQDKVQVENDDIT